MVRILECCPQCALTDSPVRPGAALAEGFRPLTGQYGEALGAAATPMRHFGLLLALTENNGLLTGGEQRPGALLPPDLTGKT